jgi:hypothetical protein
MNLAAILVVCFLNPGSPAIGAQDQAAPAQSQTPPTTAPTPTSPASKPQDSTAKPKSTQHRPRKKTNPSDCSPATTAAGADKTASASNSASMVKPCPPPKVVVRNGGSDEPTVELKGDTSADKASYERSTTEQLSAGTEENLKKIAGQELTSSQQEIVNQVKQFMEQSKAAIAAGDLERGHNLAVKAHVLSEELVKP